MLLQRIQQQFIDSADLKYQCAQSLAPAVEAAVTAMLASLTGGGKLLTCGNGAAAAAAQQVAAGFLGRHERERPGLAAFSLAANAAVITGIADDFESRAVFARQVRALGQSGDVLLLITAQGQAANLAAAVEAAHERDMTVVALTGLRPGPVAAALRDTDVHIAVPSDQASRVLELHQLVLHCIADGLDTQLLGPPEVPATEQEKPI